MVKRFLTLACITLSATCWAAPGRYGAIVLNKFDGSYGYSVNHDSRLTAERVAMEHCGALCTPVLWWADGCAALATSGKAYGSGIAGTRPVAERQALGRCPDGRCTVVLSRCSGAH